MGKIFISYRRDDSADLAARIFDRLHTYFGPGTVYMDVHAIPAGVDFRAHISHALDDCEVVLAVVGPHWFGGGSRGLRRIDRDDDFVRIEMSMALEREIDVVTLLIHDAAPLSEAELPDRLAALSEAPLVCIRSGDRFRDDVEQLIDLLRRRPGLPIHRPSHFRWAYVMLGLGVLLLLAGIVAIAANLFPTAIYRFRDSAQVTLAVQQVGFATTILLGVGVPLATCGALSVLLERSTKGGRRILSGRSVDATRRERRGNLGFALGAASCAWSVVAGLPALLLAGWVWRAAGKSEDRAGRRRAATAAILAIAGIVFNGLVVYHAWSLHTAMEFHEAGSEFLRRGELPAAIREFGRALDRCPSLAAAAKRRGIAYIRSGQLKTALPDLDFAVEALPRRTGFLSSNSDLMFAYRYRALVHESLGNAAAAESDRKQADSLGGMFSSERDPMDELDYTGPETAPQAPIAPAPHEAAPATPPAPAAPPAA